MRTTLTIDDDVMHAVRDRARREHRSVGDVLSEVARSGLVHAREALGTTEVTVRNGWPVLPHRGPPVTRELVAELLDELE